jgi:hypothetical protein
MCWPIGRLLRLSIGDLDNRVLAGTGGRSYNSIKSGYADEEVGTRH